MRVVHGLVILGLTLLTQLGGIAWAMALAYRKGRLAFFAAFVLGYGLLLGAAQMAAPYFGRVPLPCFGDVLRVQSPLYCVMMRNFVTPDVRAVAVEAAQAVAAEFPGTVTLALDGNFPFFNGIPLLPHLSHDDGDKLDFAFYYTSPEGVYLPGETASPIGYFAFEPTGKETCPPAFPTLRWDMGWFQPFNRALPLDSARTQRLVRVLLDDPRVSKVFLEPSLAARLVVSGDKLRFQGCRAARHDDHIHMQL